MSKQNVFIPLLRHEFSFRRRRCRSGGSRISKTWWLIYIAIFLMLFVIFTTWAALHNSFQIEGIWFITFALPFMIFFFGFAKVMGEWGSHTAGWWLALPYPRKTLIGAKFAAAWLRMLLVLAASYLLIILFAAYITLIESRYGGSDLTAFIVSGSGWYLLLVAFSPLAVALGILTSTLRHTELRPLMPLCFLVYYLSGYAIFWAMGLDGAGIYNQFSGDSPVQLFPYSLIIFYPMVVGWIVSYLLIRWSAYLLEKKLTM